MRIKSEYVREAEMLDVKETRKAKIQDLERFETQVEFFLIFNEEIKKWDGKKLTKRLTNNIKSMVDHLTISFNRDKAFDSIQIKVWEKSYNNPLIWFTFHGDDCECFDYAKFEKDQQYWFTGIYENIEKHEGILKTLKTRVKTYNQAVKAFNDALSNLDKARKALN